MTLRRIFHFISAHWAGFVCKLLQQSARSICRPAGDESALREQQQVASQPVSVDQSAHDRPLAVSLFELFSKSYIGIFNTFSEFPKPITTTTTKTATRTTCAPRTGVAGRVYLIGARDRGGPINVPIRLGPPTRSRSRCGRGEQWQQVAGWQLFESIIGLLLWPPQPLSSSVGAQTPSPSIKPSPLATTNEQLHQIGPGGPQAGRSRAGTSRATCCLACRIRQAIA